VENSGMALFGKLLGSMPVDIYSCARAGKCDAASSRIGAYFMALLCGSADP